MTPAVWGRHHNRMWKQWGGVSTGRTTRTGQSSPFKRPAANNLCGGIVPHGSLTDGFSTNTATFFAVHFTSVAAATGRTRSLGGLGGGAALSFDSHRGSAMRVGTLAAAQPPECAFLRRFRVSGFCLRSFAQAKNAGNSGDAVGNPLYTDVKYPVKIHPVFRITLQYTTECAAVTRAFRDFFVRYCLILPRGRQFTLKNPYRTGF